MASRGYTEGFLRRHIPISELQNYEKSASSSDKQQFVGEVTGTDSQTGRVWVEVKNQFFVGDSLLLMSPQGNRYLSLPRMWDKNGNLALKAPGAGHQVQIELPADMTADFMLIIRDLPNTTTQGCA